MILQWKKPWKVNEPWDFKCPWKGHPTPCSPVCSNFDIWGRKHVSTGFLWTSLYDCPFSIQSELIYCSVCGIAVQSSELPQWIFKQSLSRHEQWSLCSVGTAAMDSAFSLQLWKMEIVASHQNDGLTAFCSTQTSHSRGKKPSFPVGAEGERNILGLAGISRSRNYHIFAQHDASCGCLFSPPAKQLFRSKQIHTPQWSCGLAPEFLQEGMNFYESPSWAFPRQLSPQ